ncbi:FAD:protein FMN transferase [Thioflexithrix psekupsensis]|uniref:FAD:protein FMN transferase n=1 Tax=Thioflexithrix psekupsensis TaxID=1570016 RepID=UPI001C3D82D0|nr:FAD:protein FMN transferase [Thioflexithrix psekupsensis]
MFKLNITLLGLLLLLTACNNGDDHSGAIKTAPVRLTGSTMGTNYTIVLPTLPETLNSQEVQTNIDTLLQDINAKMSTYQRDSELSRFNQNSSVDWVDISPELFTVIAEARRISEWSQGAFDVTVGPLVNLWGFGPDLIVTEPPHPSAIDAVKDYVGYEKLNLRFNSPAIKKDHPQIYVDLSAIAKGYGVDRIADYLETLNINHYMVDIGGELRVKGHNPRGEAWKIAVEKPISEGRAVQQVLRLEQTGVATSGDYRNYFEHEGKRYSHTIDPTHYAPIAHDLVSVTVLHPQAMTADALATAFMVLGTEKAFILAEKQQIAALFLSKTETGFTQKATTALQPFLEAK